MRIWKIINCEWVKCLLIKHNYSEWWEHPSSKYMRMDNWKTFSELDSNMNNYIN